MWKCFLHLSYSKAQSYLEMCLFQVSFCLLSDLMKKIDKAATDYLNKVRHMSPEKRTNQLNQIESMFSKSREFGDDKVALAMQTYEMVAVYIYQMVACI